MIPKMKDFFLLQYWTASELALWFAFETLSTLLIFPNSFQATLKLKLASDIGFEVICRGIKYTFK